MIHRASEHRARAIVALLLAVLAALTLAACGGDDEKDSGGASTGSAAETADARTLLRDTFSGTKDVRSGRFALSMRLMEKADGSGDTVAISLGGPFEAQGDRYPKFDVALDARLGATGDYTGGLVSTSDRLFVEIEGDAYEIPAEYLDLARQQTGASADRAMTIPDLDPQSWIEDPQVVGQEEVGGVQTDHISATMNVSAFLDSIDRVLAEVDRQGLGAAAGGQVPTSIPADARADIERAVTDPRVDVWTGSDDKTLRKLQVDLGVAPPGERPGAASVVLELSDLNAPQTIAAPTDTRPIGELLAGLGSLLGGSVPGAGSGGEEMPDGAADYVRCIQEAGSDIAATQRCEALLR